MGLITVIIVALGLAMDAFAVSVVSGTAYKRLNVRHALRMAFFFGGFQAFMPLIGYLAGLGVKEYIENYDHWVAFGLLVAVGGKMIYESLAIGITLSIITNRIIAAAIIIGLVTFVLSYIGVFIGKRFGHFFESKIEAAGGFILIGLGVKILVEHLFS